MIGISITTKNRREAFLKCINMHYKFGPKEKFELFIVDDCSNDIYCDSDYRFESTVGISKAKNKCIELMYNANCTHFFCFDDDSYPLKQDWHLPYVNSGEHHLCATFLPKHITFSKTITRDLSEGTIQCYSQWQQEFKTHLLGNGYCLYFTRECIETVGGFDTNYKNKYEHCDLSRRIFNAGLTKHIYQDVINSNELIYCLDQDSAIQRSFTNREMQQNLKDGYDYFRSQEKSSRYIEFRT